jgi:3-oxoadipate enol-lactonase/4-carboxymuconolactone decarboxylase
VAELAGLVVGLADRLDIECFDYAGISIGGAIGLHLAVHHPARVRRLAVVCSAARIWQPAAWRERAGVVRASGVGELAESASARWFTAALADSPAAHAMAADLRAVDPESYAACCDALSAYDLSGDLAGIGVPTLVIAGREDPVVSVAEARRLADSIGDAALAEIPRASHLAPVEQPGAVLAALTSHFADGAADDQGRYREGLATRRAVLGDGHVDRAIGATTAFTADFQDFITRYAWGEVWNRPGLDRRTRSCVTLTALAALGHQAELALHVRAAIRNGLTHEEIAEVLLHSAVYCGVPAANAAFATASRVLADIAAEA